MDISKSSPNSLVGAEQKFPLDTPSSKEESSSVIQPNSQEISPRTLIARLSEISPTTSPEEESSEEETPPSFSLNASLSTFHKRTGKWIEPISLPSSGSKTPCSPSSPALSLMPKEKNKREQDIKDLAKILSTLYELTEKEISEGDRNS